MWDLIVSVPDHCLSFYFDRTFLAVYFLPREMSASKYAGSWELY